MRLLDDHNKFTLKSIIIKKHHKKSLKVIKKKIKSITITYEITKSKIEVA